MGAPKKTQATAQAKCESVREALLESAQQLFAEKGFDGVSVKELAQAAGHNAALINYYFQGKEGLYRECMMPLFGGGSASMDRTLRTPTCKQDFVTRFSLFVEDFVTTQVEHKELCTILKRDSHLGVVKRLFKDHFVCIADRLQSFFKAAKRAGIIRRDIDTELATHVFIGSVFELISFDRLKAEQGEAGFLDDKHRAATVRQLASLMLAALLPCDC